jgi:hypothetical protein
VCAKLHSSELSRHLCRYVEKLRGNATIEGKQLEREQHRGEVADTTVVTDSSPNAVNAQHLSATNSFTVVVNEVNSPPVLAALSNRTVNVGQTISFTATATDPDIPTETPMALGGSEPPVLG